MPFLYGIAEDAVAGGGERRRGQHTPESEESPGYGQRQHYGQRVHFQSLSLEAGRKQHILQGLHQQIERNDYGNFGRGGEQGNGGCHHQRYGGPNHRHQLGQAGNDGQNGGARHAQRPERQPNDHANQQRHQ